jgi:predicted kinase
MARSVKDRLEGRLLRTDVVRKELFPDPDYTKTEERAVYRELLTRAEATLEEGQSAILDGTFYDSTYRDQAEHVAGDCAAGFRIVHVTCDETVVEDRIRARHGDESDATFEIHKRFREKFQPIEREHLTVDNSGNVTEGIETVRSAFGRRVEAE